MEDRILSNQSLNLFRDYLIRAEKSAVTIEKYLRDAKKFYLYSKEQRITKEHTVEYKKYLQERGYAARSINSMLASLNCFLVFLGWTDCKVKTLHRQREIYCAEEKELTKAEYMRLLDTAKSQEQLYILLQTICSTGIRVSELKFFTVESVRKGEVVVQCKSKTRTVLLPYKLKKILLNHIKKREIKSGPIFVTRTGKCLDRSNIWTKMKQLGESAGVMASKVFPHNLRKLFARTFYERERRI